MDGAKGTHSGGALKTRMWRKTESPLFLNPPLCLLLPTIYPLQTDRLPASGVEEKVQRALQEAEGGVI